MTHHYTYIARTPTLDEYRNICVAVGWRDYVNFDVASDALANSIYSLVVEYEGTAIGMGRIVGDGHIFFYIQDIAILPNHQGHGIGRNIMQHIMDYLHKHAPDKAFVGLFAATGTQSFYNRFGFNVFEEDSTGMSQAIRRNTSLNP
jgi:ribosomal protein S18 acetylase RimI-like enzyme